MEIVLASANNSVTADFERFSLFESISNFVSMHEAICEVSRFQNCNFYGFQCHWYEKKIWKKPDHKNTT